MVKVEGFPGGVLPLLSPLALVPRLLDGEGPRSAAERGRALDSPGGVDTLLPFARGESLGGASSKDKKRLVSPAPDTFGAIGMVSVLAARGMGVLLVPSREPFLARTQTGFGNAGTTPPLALLGSVGTAGLGGEALSPERDVALVGVDECFTLTVTGGVEETLSAMGMVFDRTILTLAASAVPWRGACCFGISSTSLRFPSLGEDEKTRRARSAIRDFSFLLRMASFSSVSKISPSKPPPSFSSLPPPLSGAFRDLDDVAAVTRLAVSFGESANSLRGLYGRVRSTGLGEMKTIKASNLTEAHPATV